MQRLPFAPSRSIIFVHQLLFHNGEFFLIVLETIALMYTLQSTLYTAVD